MYKMRLELIRPKSTRPKRILFTIPTLILFAEAPGFEPSSFDPKPNTLPIKLRLVGFL